MRRKTLKAIACAAMMALTLSVTACGGSDDAKSTDTAAVEDTADTEAETDTEAEPEVEADSDAEAETETEDEVETEDEAASGQTLEDFFSDPAVKPLLDSMMDSYQEEGMSMTYELNGNEFIYVFKYTDDSVSGDEVVDLLNEYLEENTSQFESVAKSFDDELGTSGACTVVVRYLDASDNVLAEKSFSAN